MRLLLSFLAVEPDVRPELEAGIGKVLAVAAKDKDEWVKVVHDIITAHHDGATLDQRLHENPVFVEAVQMIMASSADRGVPDFLPIEAAFLNRTYSPPSFAPGQQQHFKLRQMPPKAERHRAVVAPHRKSLSSFSMPMKTPLSAPNRRESTGFGTGIKMPPPRRSLSVSGADRRSGSSGQGPTGSRRDFLNKRTSGGGAASSGNSKLIDLKDTPQAVSRGLKRKSQAMLDATGAKPGASTAEDTPEVPPPTADHSQATSASGELPASTSSMLESYIGGMDSYSSQSTDPLTPIPSYDQARANLEQAPSQTYEPQGYAQQVQQQQEQQQQSTEAIPLSDTNFGGSEVQQRPQTMDPKLQEAIFVQSNKLTTSDRALIEAFVIANGTMQAPSEKDVQHIILHEEREGPENTLVEQVVFEITYSTGKWRRLRRRPKRK